MATSGELQKLVESSKGNVDTTRLDYLANLKSAPELESALTMSIQDVFRPDIEQISQQRGAAAADFYKAPEEAAQKYAGVFDPQQRAQLRSGYVGSALEPYITQSSMLQGLGGGLSDLIGQALRAEGTRLAGSGQAYDVSRQGYGDMLNEYMDAANREFQNEQFDWGKQMDLSNLSLAERELAAQIAGGYFNRGGSSGSSGVNTVTGLEQDDEGFLTRLFNSLQKPGLNQEGLVAEANRARPDLMSEINKTQNLATNSTDTQRRAAVAKLSKDILKFKDDFKGDFRFADREDIVQTILEDPDYVLVDENTVRNMIYREFGASQEYGNVGKFFKSIPGVGWLGEKLGEVISGS